MIISSLAEYFKRERPKPKFYLGDRVKVLLQLSGKQVRIRAVVMNDSMISEEQGQIVHVYVEETKEFHKVKQDQVKSDHSSVG